ncbi:cysteine hydrolase family protein [Desulfovibrio inopinatus]|uniref:cysteine hydrolase family protein n=1 Tax=Desulfovibrio inopinatus TaxID=102109 RepID=UPI000419FC48|nr:cysteine hydrolase family protein [Desulfovibrio inopinatus]
MKTALLLIDIQNDYAPEGALALPHFPEAAQAASRLLDTCRQSGIPAIHVQHHSIRPGVNFMIPDTHGAAIHDAVTPIPGEPIVIKHYPNSFRETDLKARLDALHIDHLYVAGCMTNTCVDSTVRAAVDMGYSVTLFHDACAAMPFTVQGHSVNAADVHTAFTGALGLFFATLQTVDEFLATSS